MTKTITKIFATTTAEELQAAESAIAAYSEWRSLEGCPQDAGLSAMACLQVYLMRWERRNFGLQPPWASALGIVEEFGELMDAINEVSTEGAQDAIGDILVFACGLCSKIGIDFGVTLSLAVHWASGQPTILGQATSAAGWLAHVTLKTSQKIRGYQDPAAAKRDSAIAIGRVVRAVVCMAAADGFDARETFIEVAGMVLRRDWVEDSERGGDRD